MSAALGFVFFVIWEEANEEIIEYDGKLMENVNPDDVRLILVD